MRLNILKTEIVIFLLNIVNFIVSMILYDSKININI